MNVAYPRLMRLMSIRPETRGVPSLAGRHALQSEVVEPSDFPAERGALPPVAEASERNKMARLHLSEVPITDIWWKRWP